MGQGLGLAGGEAGEVGTVSLGEASQVVRTLTFRPSDLGAM